jgi:hypothetical protein
VREDGRYAQFSHAQALSNDREPCLGQTLQQQTRAKIQSIVRGTFAQAPYQAFDQAPYPGTRVHLMTLTWESTLVLFYYTHVSLPLPLVLKVSQMAHWPGNWLPQGEEEERDLTLPSTRPRFPKQMLPYRNEWEFTNLLKVAPLLLPALAMDRAPARFCGVSGGGRLKHTPAVYLRIKILLCRGCRWPETRGLSSRMRYIATSQTRNAVCCHVAAWTVILGDSSSPDRSRVRLWT